MLKTMRTAVAAIAFTAVAGVAQAQGGPPPIKLGYVNTAALMQAAPGRVAAESLYAKEATAFQAQQKRWGDSISKLVTAYQKAEPTLTPAQKTAQQEKIQGVQADFEALNLKGQQRMQQRENEMLAPLMEIVKTAIEEIRTEGGYALIFSGDQNSPIVAADKNLDLTDKVISRLNTMAAKKATNPSTMGPAAVTKRPPPDR